MAFPQSHLLILLLVLTTAYLSYAYSEGLNLSPIGRSAINFSSSFQLPPEYETHYYNQRLDHFNYYPESYATFQQRYLLNFKYWGGVNTSSPIFVYVGEEGDIEYDVNNVTFICEMAARFNGLLLFIEHRYYGKSLPIDTTNQTFAYLSSEQALADYAQIVTDVKNNLSAQNCPVVAVGGSYGGMLASWFRLKYPHIINGALASSAPILYFEGITPHDAFYVVASNDFLNTSESCYNTIKQSWSEIDSVASQTDGLETLAQMFKFCYPLTSAQQLKTLLQSTYTYFAQYDNPPYYYVENFCKGADGAPQGSDILARIVAGLNATGVTFGICSPSHVTEATASSTTPWQWQLHGATPRPYWVPIQFGGHTIKSALENFGSNIIYSNGMRDPWSAGGVLEDISDTIVAIHTDQGAHCLDILTPKPSDPEWLLEQREKEINTISSWLADYYAKLGCKTGNKFGLKLRLSA